MKKKKETKIDLCKQTKQFAFYCYSHSINIVHHHHCNFDIFIYSAMENLLFQYALSNLFNRIKFFKRLSSLSINQITLDRSSDYIIVQIQLRFRLAISKLYLYVCNIQYQCNRINVRETRKKRK